MPIFPVYIRVEKQYSGLCMSDAVLLSEGVYMIGGPVSVPKLLSSIDCPEAEGGEAVRVQGIVGADGIPYNLRVIDPVSPDLAKIAAACVYNWRFEPALKDGEPVAVGITFWINGPSYPADLRSDSGR